MKVTIVRTKIIIFRTELFEGRGTTLPIFSYLLTSFSLLNPMRRRLGS